ncbi:MAG: hypothetical protein WCO00_13920 [Rhodospirillaceae bacterium]
MSGRVTLDNWILIPVGGADCIFGHVLGTKSLLVTSEVINIDGMNPPRWAVTKSGSHYNLKNRDVSINKYSSAAVFDTLSKRGFSAEQIAQFLDVADRINKQCESGTTINVLFHQRRESRVATAAPPPPTGDEALNPTVNLSDDWAADARKLALELDRI